MLLSLISNQGGNDDGYGLEIVKSGQREYLYAEPQARPTRAFRNTELQTLQPALVTAPHTNLLRNNM